MDVDRIKEIIFNRAHHAELDLRRTLNNRSDSPLVDDVIIAEYMGIWREYDILMDSLGIWEEYNRLYRRG